MKPHVTAVVPAYNEEGTIGAVLKTLEMCKLIDKIIVINDGSEDSTAEIARRYKVEVVDFKHNLGKSQAVKKVCSKINTDIVFFCDADIVGIKVKDVEDIILPVLNGRVRMSLGCRKPGPDNVGDGIFARLTGERAILFSDLQQMLRSKYFIGWGMENVSNEYCRRMGLPVRKKTYNYGHIWKHKKTGFRGAIDMAKEGREVISTWVEMRVMGRF